MRPYLEFETLSYDTIGEFIEEAVRQEELDPVFLMGKAAGYVDVAYALGGITGLEAKELLTCIGVYTGA